jgi:hypothetical protein
MDWTDLAQDRTVEGFCIYGNEPSGSITSWDILEKFHNWQLLQKDSAP